jgi:hypothetical protein
MKKEAENILNLDLFKELGLDSFSTDEKMGLMEEAAKVVIGQIWLRIAESLSPSKQKELDDLLLAGNQEGIEKFLKSEIPNLEELVKEEIASYKSLLISSIKKG